MSLTQLELQRSSTTQHDSLPSCQLEEATGPKEDAFQRNDPLELLQHQEEYNEMNKSRNIPLLTINSSQENLSANPNEPEFSGVETKTVQPEPKGQPSDELPHWMLTVAQKALGIASGPEESFRIATTLHVLTFATGLLFIVTYSWFIFYDISSGQTKRDALNGIVSIIISIFWTSLAVYSNCLAYRMFDHKVFIQNIRLHSKSVLKCNAAVVLFIGGLVFITLDDYGSVVEFRDKTCELVELDLIVCKIMYVSRVAFSFFAFLWNMLVAVVLLAVCRTHTFGIRKFIHRLRADARVQSIAHLQNYPAKDEKFSQATGDVKFTSVFYFNNRASICPEQEHSTSSSNVLEMESPVTTGALPSNDSDTEILLGVPLANVHARRSDTESVSNDNIRAQRPDSQETKVSVNNVDVPTKPTLVVEEILHQYWSLQSDIWVTSNTLQRWMLCFVCLCLIWIGVTLVHWLSSSPQTIDVVLFVIPLLMLPVLCSAYAEVNNESQRMSRTIYPSEDRLWMLFYLQQAPLQMTIYGYPIKYSTVVTSIFGLVAALTSGIVLQEIRAL